MCHMIRYYLYFLKLFFVFKNEEKKKKLKRTYLVFFFFFVLKNIRKKILNSKNKNSFQKIPKILFLIFLKTTFKNNFKKYKANKPTNIKFFYCVAGSFQAHEVRLVNY